MRIVTQVDAASGLILKVCCRASPEPSPKVRGSTCASGTDLIPSLASLLFRNPLDHVPLQHIQRHRARTEYNVMKLAHVKLITQFALGTRP